MRQHFALIAVPVLFGLSLAGQAPAPAQVPSRAPSPEARAPIEYRLSFPEPEHCWMEVEVVFPEVGDRPLQIRMSRTSPGRYALHEFAKNMFDVRVSDGQGRPLAAARPNLHQWDVAGHGGTVRVAYKIYGDRIDGTYLSVDATHAHMNVPATLVWARGLEDRPARIRLERPPGTDWRVATQLYPTGDPLTFTVPNLQYLMDSSMEFSRFALRSFTVLDPARPGVAPTFRIALHHDGTDGEADAYAADVERIVRETVAIYGEFPDYETGTYTFLADYLPYASGDGMEHRNSTVLTSSGPLRRQREGLLGTVAHEFFHGWNVERIRPRALEPFDFEEANVSGELWLAEGVTSYYDGLIMQRAGLSDLSDTAAEFTRLVNVVTLAPGRRLRSAVEMSLLAPFVDAARAVDRTNWDNTHISYYTWGAAIGLGLDLALRDRTNGAVSLDDYMRALWRAHGKPGGRAPGYVDRPYTLADARRLLAEVAVDRAFADDFFTRYIEGREVVDYARLLQRAGLELRQRAAGAAWLGDVRLDLSSQGARVAAPVPFGSPLYAAGVDQDDRIVSLDGASLASGRPVDAILSRRKPGERIEVAFVRRDGARRTGSLVLVEDPHVQVVPIEAAGGRLTGDQRRFREGWLGTKRK